MFVSSVSPSSTPPSPCRYPPCRFTTYRCPPSGYPRFHLPACRSPPRRSHHPYHSYHAHPVQQCSGPARQSMLGLVVGGRNHQQKSDLRTYKEANMGNSSLGGGFETNIL